MNEEHKEIDGIETNVSEFFDDIHVKEEVEKIWGEIFDSTYQVIKNSDLYAFEEIEIKSNPNIHQLIAATSMLEFMLDRTIEYVECMDEIDYSLIRMLINARQQIVLLKDIATALKIKDKQLFESSVRQLKTQAPI